MRTTTYNYTGHKAKSSYNAVCPKCEKTSIKNVSVEHTVNPFNRHKDGTLKTYTDVMKSSEEKAKSLASEYEGREETCKACKNNPSKELLIYMARNPDDKYEVIGHVWGSAMMQLEDRGQVSHMLNDHNGYKINKKGIERAKKFKDFESININFEELEIKKSPYRPMVNVRIDMDLHDTIKENKLDINDVLRRALDVTT